jgi:arylsulfatase A-like enzyme
MADVAPTLLALMATPIPAHMDGTAVAAALRVPIVTTTGLANAGPPSADTPRSTEESDAAMKKQLKDLGYM